MALLARLALLALLSLQTAAGGGGHGGSHHKHVKIHVPEIIEHKHHTKYIVIHHHPKKSGGGGGHHIPKISHKPHGHHFFFHKKKGHKKMTTSTHTHGHHGHKHGHKQHGHKHVHKETKKPHHHDYEEEEQDEYIPFTPQSYLPQPPKVFGVSHTFKEVKMYDSLPFSPGQNPFKPVAQSPAAPSLGHGFTAAGGYQVTEQGDDDSLVGFPQYTTTYQTQQDPFAAINSQQDPFAAINPQPASGSGGVTASDFFSQYQQQNEAPASATDYGNADFSDGTYQGYGYGNQNDASNYGEAENLISNEHNDFLSSFQPQSHIRKRSDHFLPISYERATGVRKTIKTGGHQTLVY